MVADDTNAGGSPLVDRLFPEFHRDLSSSLKRYRNAARDVEAFARLLDINAEKQRGARMQGFGPVEVYKTRVISRDIPAGKSGGFRVILTRHQGIYYFVMIYTHTTRRSESDIRHEIVRRLRNHGWLD